jgi:hypothetical protein
MTGLFDPLRELNPPTNPPALRVRTSPAHGVRSPVIRDFPGW